MIESGRRRTNDDLLRKSSFTASFKTCKDLRLSARAKMARSTVKQGGGIPMALLLPLFRHRRGGLRTKINTKIVKKIKRRGGGK